MTGDRINRGRSSDDWVRPSPRHWPPGVHALTTTRRRPAGAATGTRTVQWLNQVHGSRCVEARVDTAHGRPEADAAWTREPGLGLAVLTADCVPVVVAHREATLVGVAHGGWRGLVSGVLENLIRAMPAPPGELSAWLGPAIGPAVYEVGEDVTAAVRALPHGERLAVDCLREGAAGRWHLDLFTLTTLLLERAGVHAVHTERLCTYSDARFFSYRREGRTGRMVTLAWLEE